MINPQALIKFNLNETAHFQQIVEVAQQLNTTLETQHNERLQITLSSEIVHMAFTQSTSNPDLYHLTQLTSTQGAIIGSRFIFKEDDHNQQWSKGDTGTITNYHPSGTFTATLDDPTKNHEVTINDEHLFHTYASPKNNIYINQTAAAIIRSSPNTNIQQAILNHCDSFEKKLNKHERLQICHWFGTHLYFEVHDQRKTYPNNIRCLVSYNSSSGEFYSGPHKHYVVRHGWSTFLQKLLNSYHALQPA